MGEKKLKIVTTYIRINYWTQYSLISYSYTAIIHFSAGLFLFLTELWSCPVLPGSPLACYSVPNYVIVYQCSLKL